MNDHELTTVVLHSIPDSFNMPFHDHYDMDFQKGYQTLVNELEAEHSKIEWLQHYSILPTTHSDLLVTDIGQNFYGHILSAKEERLPLLYMQQALDKLLQCDKESKEWTQHYTTLQRELANIKRINNLSCKMSWLPDCVRYGITE